MTIRRPTLFTLVCCLLVLLFCKPARAHSMYQSSVLLDYRSASLDAELQLPPSRLSQAMGVALTEQTMPSKRQQIERYILERFQVRSTGYGEWQEELSMPLSWQSIDGAPYVVANLHFTPPR